MDEEQKTRRQRIVSLLKEQNLCAEEVRLKLGFASTKMIKEDLQHIAKSHKVRVERAECNTCGFKFSKDSPAHKMPGKCPKCHSTDVKDQRLHIQE